MRKYGIHLSYWTTSWTDDLMPLLEKAKAAGFDGAELPVLNPESMNFKAYKERAEELGLELTCCTGLSPEADISHPDPKVRARGLEHLRRCLHAAGEVESPVLAGVLHLGWGAAAAKGEIGDYSRRSAEALKIVAAEAETAGITLCVEILNRYESFFLNTVGEGLDFIDTISSPAVKLLLDTYHMHIEEDNMPSAVINCGSSLGHLHCSANNRKRPGLGSVPWPELGKALSSINYEGWLVMECFVQPGGEVGPATKTWRKLYEDLDEDAWKGCSYLRSLSKSDEEQ